MKVTTEQIEKYIKKHPEATAEEIAHKLSVCKTTIERRTKAMGYVMRKVWVRV